MSKAKDLAGLVSTGGILADGTVNLTSEVTGTLPIASGGTNATTADGALTALGGTTVGTGVFKAVDAAAGRTAISAASTGANSDITSLSGLTTALSVAQGGTGLTSPGTAGNALLSNGTGWVSGTVSSVSPPLGGLMPIVYSGSPDTITVNGGTWLKSGVVAPSTTYPNAPSAPFAQQIASPTTTYNIINSAFPAFGNEVWVFPVDGGVTITTDFYNWSFVSLNNTISGSSQLTFINNKFVIIQGATVWQSTNGTTWTSADSMPVSGTWCRPVWTGTRYITGNSQTTNIAYSSDLTTWTQVDVTNNPHCVGWNGTRVVVGCTNNTMKYSSDGISYTNVNISQGNAGTTLTYQSVAWNGSRWVALSNGYYDSGYNYFYIWPITSTDGIAWNGPYQTMTSYGARVSAVGSTFYVMGNSSISSDNATYGWSSTNGSTWTALQTQYTQYYVYPPNYTNQAAVSATNGSTTAIGITLTRNNGTTWGSAYLNSSGLNTTAIAYNAGNYIVAFSPQQMSTGTSRNVAVSTNGLTWNTNTNVPDGKYSDAAYFNGRWYMSGDRKYNNLFNSPAVSSTDLVNWSTISGNSFGKMSVAGSILYFSQWNSDSPTTLFYYTTDGTTLNAEYLPASGNQAYFAYGNSVYLAVNSANQVFRSSNGMGSWTGISVNTASEQPIGIFFLNGRFVLLTQNGKVFTSTNNGTTWTSITPTGTNDMGGVFQSASCDGQYIFATRSGQRTYLVSNDAINFYWRKTASVTFGEYSTVANGIISHPNMGNVQLNMANPYVLNDTAQYGMVSTTQTGSPMYMRVA